MAKDPEHIGELKRALGQRLADLRKAAAVTQQDVARHTFVDRTYVSHAERGQQMPTERSFWVAADEYLGANGCLCAAFDEVVAAQHQVKQAELDALRARHQISSPSPPAHSGSLRTAALTDAQMRSDAWRDHGPNPLAEAYANSELELIEFTRLAEATDISAGTLDELEVVTDQLCRDYPTADAAQLRASTSAHLRYVLGRLDGRTTFAQHRELLVRAGWLALLLGCVTHDLGDRSAAGRARRLASRLGQQAEHGQIIAWSYELGAWYALLEGHYPTVVDLSHRGLQHAGVSSAAVQLTLQAGRGYARMGDGQARTALDAGRKILDQLPRPDHPEHHFVFDPDKHIFYVATILTWLGKDDTAAQEHAHEVVRYCHETGRWPMRLGTTLVNLGMIAGRRGDLDEAIEHGTAALDLNRRSAELIPQAEELYRDLTSRYPKERLIDHYRERLIAAKRESGGS
jgi:transcriptional regulator with XRE-family HTH domain